VKTKVDEWERMIDTTSKEFCNGIAAAHNKKQESGHLLIYHPQQE
jgi:pyocin large subunit-like protein